VPAGQERGRVGIASVGEFALTEGAVGDAAEQLRVVAERPDVAPSDPVGIYLEVVALSY